MQPCGLKADTYRTLKHILIIDKYMETLNVRYPYSTIINITLTFNKQFIAHYEVVGANISVVICLEGKAEV